MNVAFFQSRKCLVGVNARSCVTYGKDTYIENKVQNTFTAYLIKAVHGARNHYLAKRNKILVHEDYLEDMSNLPELSLEEYRDRREWKRAEFDDLEDQRLFKAIMWLQDKERKIIYLHIFEEKTFTEIALQLHLSESVAKGRYYYALAKIRNRMKGE